MRALLMAHGYDAEAGAPDPLPDGWEVEPIGGSQPWYAVTHPSGRRVFAWRENEDGTGALAVWAVFGEAADLSALGSLAASTMSAREAWRRRAEPAIRAHLRRWRAFRCAGAERIDGQLVAFDGVRSLVPRGIQIPDPGATPLPWHFAADGSLTTEAAAVRSVSSVERPSLAITLASASHPARFESEPDAG